MPSPGQGMTTDGLASQSSCTHKKRSPHVVPGGLQSASTVHARPPSGVGG